MDPEMWKLLIINFPNFVGFIVLSAVLLWIYVQSAKSLDKRILFLEVELSKCLADERQDNEPD